MKPALPAPSILPLSDPLLTLALGGGKAKNLGAMLRAQLPVPDGFVVTTEVYRAFTAANGLDATIERAWSVAAGTDAQALEQASANVRAAFEAGVVPPAVVDAVAEAYARLGRDVAVAVRSSATAEDLAEASFAGQQDTYLNIRGADALLEAVRRCWGSLWTARAMAYRARQGIAPAQVALAVVVQRLAPATAAGVLFTVHPVTGRRDRAVVNATWGLGEALVSGRVNPDTLVVDKASGRVLRRERGDKAVMTSTTGTGTAEVDVPEAERARFALDDAQAAALVRHGVTLEALFDGPQDVEWAIADGAPVLLQSRAVTTTAPQVPGDDAWAPTERAEPQPFDFWTQQDLGERWPEPVCPLTWSVSESLNQDLMDFMLAGLKAPFAGKVRWTLRAFGRAYLNEGALAHAYTHGLGMPLSMVRSAVTHPGATPPDSERWRTGRALAHLPYFWRAATTWEKNVTRFEADFPLIDGWVEAFLQRPLADLPDADLVREADQTWRPRLAQYVRPHTNATSMSIQASDQLAGFVTSHGGSAELAQDLVGGLTGVTAAEMVPAMGAMAQALRDAGLVEVALGADPAAALRALRADPRAAPFLALLATFLRTHGHRCMIEAELRVPRWQEAPEQVLLQLAPLLRSAPQPSSASTALARREAATAKLMGELGWWGRAMLTRLLGRAHRLTRMRDNGQNQAIKLMLPLRMLYAELGRRWALRGWLRSADDVFFLQTDELSTLASADARQGAPFDAQAKADARRLAHEHWLKQGAPDALDATQEPVAALPIEASGDPNTLVGVPASRGLVTGIARVVLSPADAGRLQRGDILVTRATDPGWTPVFAVIGGAVLEVGGVLSHGAIVAREYGLPAIVNVAQCTQRIVDGARISVDGATGRVTLLEAPRSQLSATDEASRSP